MDYNTKIQDCDPHISFVVPPLSELQQRQAAMEKWFPEDAAKSGRIEESNNGKLRCAGVDIHVSEQANKASLVCVLT